MPPRRLQGLLRGRGRARAAEADAPGLSTRRRVPRGTVAHVTPDGDLVAGTTPGGTRLWPFTQSRRRLWRSTRPGHLDPVNLLILRADPAAVVAALRDSGWTRPDDGATHRTWVNGTFRSMADHVALGDRAERSHARVFRLGDATLVAAHHEIADHRGRHLILSWDRARAAVAAALQSAGYTRIGDTAVITPPDLRDAPGDGRVWRMIGPGPT